MSTNLRASAFLRRSIDVAAGRLLRLCITVCSILLAHALFIEVDAAPAVVSETLPVGHWTPKSKRIRLIADSQLHEFHGAPTYLQSQEVDERVEVALRPSQQRMFAFDLLRRSMAVDPAAPTPDFVLHLGDAIDVSCSTEWDQFTFAMTASPAPWLLAPGNHDGYFTGNLLPPAGYKSWNVFSTKYGSQGWQLRCGPVGPVLANGTRLDKPQFLKRYVDALKGTMGVREVHCDSDICLGDATSDVQVRAKVSTAQPWSSYLMQKINIGATPCARDDERCTQLALILIDTSTYSSQPLFVRRPAGTFASLSSEQWPVLRTWMSHAADPTKFVVAGHHALSNFSREERRELVNLLCDSDALLYVSAHTHVGYWRRWSCDSGASLLELNVGSVLDWPSHFRELVVLQSDAGAWAVDAMHSDLGDPSDTRICDPLWIPASGGGRTPEEQQLYKAAGTSLKLGREALNRGLKAELLEYKALVRLFPTDAARVPDAAKQDQEALQRIDTVLDYLDHANLQAQATRERPEILIHWLESFEQSRRVEKQSERERYKVCLGVWAAKADHTRTIALAERRKGEKANQQDVFGRALRYALYPIGSPTE
jgi:hypothetical protein